MQAPLSSTASGKLFRTGPLTALLPATPGTTSYRQKPQAGSLIGGSHTLTTDSIAEGRGLAHDAGNLLGALGLYSELLALPGVLREEHRHYAEELRVLSGRSRELIDRLLNPATTSRRAGHSLNRVAVPDVIEGCRGVLHAVAQRAVAIAYEAGAALPVPVPKESLERILVNLTKNAAEATKDVPDLENAAAITLRVTCRKDGAAMEQIVLTVEDKGCGMSSAAVKMLLGESGASKTAGQRGIGFQVVRELVGASGGQLRLTSRIGSGTIVSIGWAVVNEAAGPVTNALEERRMLMAIARNGRTRRLSC